MNNVKRLSALLIFAEVADKQSFTIAAKKLAMSKSAISQNIKQLELDTGEQLISRNTRGMSLTAAGEKLLSRCELLRNQVELAYDEINLNKKMPSGRFALTIPHSFEKNIAIPALKQLCLEYPDLQIDLNVEDSPLDLIDNNLDVSIYAGELKDSNYRALPLGAAVEIFCASPKYLQKNKQISTLNHLLEHRVISTPWQKKSIDIYETKKHKEKRALALNNVVKTNTLSSALEIVRNDMGIALLPQFVIQSALIEGDLVRILPTYQGRQWPFYMVHRFHGDKPIHINRFYQLTKHFFTKSNFELK